MKNKTLKFIIVSLVVLLLFVAIIIFFFSPDEIIKKETSQINSEETNAVTTQGEYPFYFQPIADEIHNLAEQGNNDWWMLSTWWEDNAYGVCNEDERFTVCGGTYAQKSFTLTYEFQQSKWKTLEGEITFDLSPYITSEAEGDWLMAACFYQEERDTMYMILHNFAIWESEESQEAWIEQESGSPQLMLLECSLMKKDKQHVTAYEVEPLSRFSWAADCRMIGDTIYIANGPGDTKDIAAIDLETRELRYCVEEYQALQEYASESFDMEEYHLMLQEAVYEQDDVTVYSAKVGNDGFDGPATAHVFVAFQNGEPIDYMTYYVESQEIVCKILK